MVRCCKKTEENSEENLGKKCHRFLKLKIWPRFPLQGPHFKSQSSNNKYSL